MTDMLGCQRADLRNLRLHSSLIQDYCTQKPELDSFYSAYPSLEAISEQCLRKARSYTQDMRLKLCSYLHKLHQNLNPSPLQQSHLHALSHSNAFCITTAHQANLCSGPLYTIYKIAHCIRIAQELSHRLSAYKFVPVFFLGSEDHDSAELNHIFLHGRKFSWHSEEQGAFGRRKVDQELTQLIQSILQELRAYPYFEELRALLAHYREPQSIAQAYLKFLQDLFKDYGLLFLDPDARPLKTEFMPIFKEDIFSGRPRELIEQQIAKLSALGYKVQLRPREINSFYLGDKLRGRIVRNPEGDFRILGLETRYSSQEFLQHLEDYPENFSPNACLRGLFQEQILPSVAYVGGGGELAYWLELKPLFDHYQIPFPLLWLRHSVLILSDSNLWHKMHKAQLSLPDMLQKPSSYAQQFVRAQAPEYSQIIANYAQQFAQVYHQLQRELAIPSLNMHIQALECKYQTQLKRLESRLYRHQQKMHEIQLERQKQLYSALFPNGLLQERYANVLEFYARYGSGFIANIISNLEPYSEPTIHLFCLKSRV